MKKTLSLLAVILVLVFAVSCGGGKKDNNDTTDTEPADDTDVADTDTDTEPTEEPTEEPTDEPTEPEPTEPTEPTNPTEPTEPEPTDPTEPTEPTEETVKTHELIGRYADAWGGSHIISNTAWFQPSVYGDTLFRITQFDTENGFIIAQNDAVKSWYPEKWSRFDYIIDGEKIYFCQIAFDKETEADALAATDADRTDPAASGCNGYPWTELTEVVEEPVDKDDERIVAWATGYENYTAGENVDDEWKTPEKALGKAVGDSYDVVVLGDGGSIVLTFAKPITDGEGADFAVFENSINDGFLELGTVEVSSDGEHFVAFDNYYLGTEKVGSYSSHDARLIWGFAGKFKQGKGTMFDLAELAGKPEVTDGTLDLTAVTHIKIVDVIGDGSQKDSIGDPVYDPYPTAGSAGFDLDAVAVINELNDPFEIAGKWYAYQWGEYDTVSEKGWTKFNVMYGGSSDYTMIYEIVEYDNENDTFIAYKENTKYSKVNWILKNESGKEILYICEQSFGNETIEAAKAAADANKEDLEQGCGSNYSWDVFVRAGTTSTDAKEDMYAEREEAAEADDDYIDAWASGYDAYTPGENADSAQNDPSKVTGKADGQFLSLGKGGSILVTFTDPILLDGGDYGEIGSDFIIFANSSNNQALAKVEVSSDGETFAAFDNYFLGLEEGALDESKLFGFAGRFGNGKGTKFDLKDLALKPEVKNSSVDLEAITIIRITDIPGDGSVTDSHGNPIFYPYPAGGFEIDAVAAVE